MKHLRAVITVILLIPIAVGAVLAQTPDQKAPPSTIARLTRYLDALESRGFSGSVLVDLNGAIAISHGYGYANKEHHLSNTPGTVFDIGSITKQFTSAAILTLDMQGKLRVEDSIGVYFPGVPKDKAGITLHQLLRHASGLPSNIGRDYERITRDAFVDSVFRTPLRFAPGTRFSYSNIGYSLLAMIVEKASGQPYEEYLYTHLWKPAGMEWTGYRRPDFSPDAVATGYNRDGEVWGKPTEKPWDTDAPFWHLKGNGGVLSTTGDLLRWHHALLGTAILSEQAKVKYFHPELRTDESPDSYYAYGWDVHRTPRGTYVIQHNGANGFFYADFSRYTDEGVAIIALMNQMHPSFTAVNSELARIIFDPGYTPLIPIADNEANRAFTASLIAQSVNEGADRSFEAYKRRAPGLDLVEFRVNEKGYALLGDRQLQQAIEVFRLNVLVYPASANAFDSLGEAYMTAGMKELATENYRKSLALDPGNRNAEEMIEKLSRE